MLSLDKINAITDPKVRRQLKLDILTRVKKSTQEKYRTDLLSFVKYTWPSTPASSGWWIYVLARR